MEWSSGYIHIIAHKTSLSIFFKLASLLAICLITDSNLETSKAKELGKIVNAWTLNNMPREHIKEEIKAFLEANVDSDTTYESL